VSLPPRYEVRVDLPVLQANLANARGIVGSAKIMAVVKCDAYGHGAPRVVQALAAAGADWLGVAFLEEGLSVRGAVPGIPILVFTELAPGQEAAAVAGRLTPTVATFDGAVRLAAAGARVAHLKIDTGMHRFGADPDEVVDLAAHMRRMGLAVTGVWTHFATADRPGSPEFEAQLDTFTRCVAQLRKAGFEVDDVHAANSMAAHGDPRTRCTMVRLGAALFGLRPSPAVPGFDGYRPVMSWASSVVAIRRLRQGESVGYGLRYRAIRECVLAVVPVGFGDGMPNLAGNRGEVLVHGKRRPIAGAVGMSHISVDCGDDDTVRVGDRVVLLGGEESNAISAEELARWSGTSVYEAVTRIGPNLPRYHDER
jgi:alanine racemase